MGYTYVHLSDIHFGQEKGGDVFVHDDVKEQLLIDVHDFVASLPNRNANGVIISGDIAYAGKPNEYDLAGAWLDRLTSAVGCDLTAVQVVPGNHDIDRDKITPITQSVIDSIIEKGDDELDKYLEKEEDREFIYKQFYGYRKFAEGYDCPLDTDGRVSGHRIIEIAPGKKIKFLGVNTALICSKSKKEKGGLILGKRQRVIPKEFGLETIIIAHHPLHWLQDSEDAMRYVQNRARVFISGHEHTPSHVLEKVNDNIDLLMLASGATMPPGNEKGFTYCYNILEFDWDDQQHALKVTIHARIWNEKTKEFDAYNVHFEGGKATYFLKCPNYEQAIENSSDSGKTENIKTEKVFEVSPTEFPVGVNENDFVEEKEYHLVLLKFFRDLSSKQRLSILIELGAIPNEWTDSLTHSLERNAFDQLVNNGRLSEIHEKINQIIQKNQ